MHRGNPNLPNKTDVDSVEELKAEQVEQAAILKRVINWSAYVDSKILTDQDKSLIDQYDRRPGDEQKDLLEEMGAKYATLFIKMLTRIQDKEAVQYILTLVDLMVDADRRRAGLFHKLTASGISPYIPFVSILSRSTDAYTTSKASHVLALLLSNGTNLESPLPVVEEYLKWLIGYVTDLAPKQLRELGTSLSCLKEVLKDPYAQVVFAKLGGTKCLNNHFHAQQPNTQLLYVTSFCVWLLSFNRDVNCIAELQRFEVVKRVADILKIVSREKVVRVVFATLRNLLKHDKENFIDQMVGFALHKLCQTLAGRKWKDTDLVKDITFVGEVVSKRVDQLSSFEMYLTELMSGNLSWSPVHSEVFWGEHKTKFEEKNFERIKRLVELVDANDELTVEVACYDLGEFARFHPEGRRVVTRLGGKIKLMTRMNHKNVKIAKQALLSVQKLMVQNWDFLNKSNVTKA